MCKSFILNALILFTFVFITPLYANAAEVLSYKAPQNYKERLATQFVAEKENQEAANYVLAKTDLNNDALDEYIVKLKFCVKLQACPHTIIAISDYKAVLLGEFHCSKIVIDNKGLYGVRHLHIYKNPNNSYSFSTAYWEPFSSLYKIPEKEDSE